MKSLFPLALCVILFQLAFSQAPKYRVVSLPVERNGIQLRQPWVGGMNSPQFSPINLNGDSLKDLFVFDRVGAKVLTYVNNGSGNDTTYDYAPQYESLFPQMVAWALIKDYNNDGIADIFTHANSGTMIFKGSIQAGLLHFDTVCPLLLYYSAPYTTNIWTSITDLPVFTDVNFDGDIDVLTYTVLGGQIEYYENQTKEHPGDIHYAADSFKFLKIGDCWGNVQQNSISNAMILNAGCKGLGGLDQSGTGAERHAGNTIFSFDDGNDHDVDLLNGNLGFDNLGFLENTGDSSFAQITRWDSLWPLCNTPAIMPTYPAAFGADFNHDNLEDIFVSPNADAGGRDVKNVMLYKNVNNNLCNFEYQGDSFLVHEMIDFGTESKPVFFDFNGDGLKDMVIGNYGYYRPFTTYKSALAYYENVGTATQPKFRERSDDYNNFSTYGLIDMYPAFGDLNGDGHDDMLVGELNGYLHYFKNYGNTVASFTTLDSAIWRGMDVGQYSAPFIYDMNGDSLLDLVVGRKDGKLSYFWNMGTKTVPYFHKDSVNNLFGGINVTQVGYSDGSSQPVVYKTPGGALKLYVGSARGFVYEYDVNPNNLRSGTFALVDSDVMKADVGAKAAISIADLNSDGLLEYVVGNSRGGLLLFSDSIWDPQVLLSANNLPADNSRLQIYPNPARNYFACVIEGVDLSNARVEVYNVLGARMNAEFTANGNKIMVSTTDLNSGFYIARITQNGKSFTGKILIER